MGSQRVGHTTEQLALQGTKIPRVMGYGHKFFLKRVGTGKRFLRSYCMGKHPVQYTNCRLLRLV